MFLSSYGWSFLVSHDITTYLTPIKKKTFKKGRTEIGVKWVFRLILILARGQFLILVLVVILVFGQFTIPVPFLNFVFSNSRTQSTYSIIKLRTEIGQH
jgi:hypothetical protein